MITTKMYKGDCECTAMRDQVPTMEKAGWSLKKVSEKKSEPVVEAKPVVEEKPAKEQVPPKKRGKRSKKTE